MDNKAEYQRLVDELVGKGKVKPLKISEMKDGRWEPVPKISTRRGNLSPQNEKGPYRAESGKGRKVEK